jgi:hypothetical protein
MSDEDRSGCRNVAVPLEAVAELATIRERVTELLKTRGVRDVPAADASQRPTRIAAICKRLASRRDGPLRISHLAGWR